MKKHYVTFYSPGTFFAETTTEEIEEWDVDKAVELSKIIKERYGATPYAFSFYTKERNDTDFEPKITKESGYYFISCKKVTLEELIKKNNKEDKILISNMKCNGWDCVVQTINGWKWTQPVEKNDVIL